MIYIHGVVFNSKVLYVFIINLAIICIPTVGLQPV